MTELRYVSSDLTTVEERGSHGKLLLPSLVMSNFAAGALSVLMGLLLIDIGATFNASVGIMGQANTAYSAVAVVFALIMSFLSARFRHKSLLLIGLLFNSASAVGCLLASDFNTMLVSYSLGGLGWAMVSPMTSTLIGEHFALEKRASAIGWLIAGGSLVYVVGAPTIALIAAQGGWRLPLLEFVIPVSLASFLLALVSLPSSSHSHPCTARKETYLQSYKMILLNRSAAACLVGDVLRSAAFVAVLLYAASFVRQRFLASLNFASVVILGGALCYTLGSLASGRLVNRIGRKPSAVLTAVLAGAFTMVFMRMPNLWLSLALIFAASWFFGMLTSAANCLTLEQVPKFRGTMMSMDSASVNLGSALGAAVGGLALIRFGYEGLGSILGVLSIAAAFVFYFLATDPTRQKN